MATVRLENVGKKYDGADDFSVRGVNIDIEDGEFIVFVGPSGSGKSTALRMVAGLESISEGELYIGDRLMNDVEPKDRDIAMVFQNYALFPHMSVRDNMSFGLKVRGVSKAERNQRVEEAAEILGLTEHLDKRPGELSGGQMQRVALGRAVVKEASLFLMDEPLSNLDAKLRVKMRNEISTLQKRLGATTIYVTHDQAEAMTMADRIVCMSVGEVQQIGTPYEIYNDPVNVFVAGFLGSPSMNFIHVDVDGKKIATKNGQVLIKDEGVSNIENGEYILGSRPENIVFGEGDVPFDVYNVELLGSEYNIHGNLDGVDMTLISPADQKIGDEKTGTVKFSLDTIYLFDSTTEERVYFND